MEEIKDMKVGDLIELLANFIKTKPVEVKEKQYLSKIEVLEQYPLFTEATLYKAVKFQGLEYIKSGRNKYYDKDSIDKWIESQKCKEVYNRFEDIKFN